MALTLEEKKARQREYNKRWREKQKNGGKLDVPIDNLTPSELISTKPTVEEVKQRLAEQGKAKIPKPQTKEYKLIEHVETEPLKAILKAVNPIVWDDRILIRDAVVTTVETVFNIAHANQFDFLVTEKWLLLYWDGAYSVLTKEEIVNFLEGVARRLGISATIYKSYTFGDKLYRQFRHRGNPLAFRYTCEETGE